jgi:hypothetical protein
MDLLTAWMTMKTLAILELVAAIGIAAFWVYWLSSAKAEGWMPEGFMKHERLFVFPDLTMSGILGLSAVLLLYSNSAGLQTSLLGAGMMLFLILIDIVYLAGNGLFSPKRNGVMHLTIISLLSLVCCYIIFTSFFLL